MGWNSRQVANFSPMMFLLSRFRLKCSSRCCVCLRSSQDLVNSWGTVIIGMLIRYLSVGPVELLVGRVLWALRLSAQNVRMRISPLFILGDFKVGKFWKSLPRSGQGVCRRRGSNDQLMLRVNSFYRIDKAKMRAGNRAIVPKCNCGLFPLLLNLFICTCPDSYRAALMMI